MGIAIVTIDSEIDSISKLGYPTYTCECKVPRGETIVRWGKGEVCADRKIEQAVNPSQAIKLNVNKLVALRALKEAGLLVPRIFDDSVPEDENAVYRPINHSRGENFQVSKGPFKIDSGYYATKFISTPTEIRVWYGFGSAICARRVTSRSIPEFPCRSEWGYRFWDRVPRGLLKLNNIAFDAIGLSTGAADILKSHGRYYFLELNSAPDIDHSKIEAFYKDVFKKFEKKMPTVLELV